MGHGPWRRPARRALAARGVGAVLGLGRALARGAVGFVAPAGSDTRLAEPGALLHSGRPEGLRSPAVFRRAKRENVPARRDEKAWEQPFPKYAVGAMVILFVIGFVGGGPQLGFVLGLSGFAFGQLFEPYQTEDGTISGLD